MLEIEAVDGRSRSFASRGWTGQRRKTRLESQTLVEGLRGIPPDAAHGQSPDEEVCGVPTCSIKNSRHFGLQAQAGNQSIRWKTSRVEAASSLHWGGVRAALAMQVFSGNVVERRRGRSFWRVRKHSSDESSVARSAA